MCGLIGIFNIENAAGLAAKALEAIRNRGTEAYGIATESWIEVKKRPEDLVPIKSRNAVAHCLHSVVSYLPQPLKGKGILIANCEIYNWRELSARHRINAQNDADLLLQMLDKLGVAKTVPEIDGVFAFAYWRNGKVILARDIIGEKPLWYHFGDSFSFCSEKKALERGLDIEILFCQTIDEILAEKPDILAVGCLSQSVDDAVNAMEQTKKENPNIKVIMGGYHITLLPELLPKAADVAVLGDLKK